MARHMMQPRVLGRACELGHEKMKAARKSRVELMRHFVGRFYGHEKDGTDESRKASPINLIYRAVTTYVPNLVFNNPTFTAETGYSAFRPYADRLAMAVTHVARDEVNLRMTLRKCVVDALFLAGFIKVGLADNGRVLSDERGMFPVGDLYVARVDPDDIIIDPAARDWDEQFLCGHRFRVPKEMALESGVFDNSILEKLTGRYDENTYRDEASSVSDGRTIMDKYREVGEYIDLQEVWIPSEKIIVTLPWTTSGPTDKFLRVSPHVGNEAGPFRMLGFNYVGDNVLPVSPMGVLADLHTLGNRIARKMSKQAERNKRVVVYEGTARDDAQTLSNADDGEMIQVDDVQSFKELEYGGASDKSYEWMAFVKGEFSEMAGNVEQLAGVRSDAGTATQAEIMQNNASVRLADAQQLVYDFAEGIGKDIGFFLHTDPLIELPMVRRSGSTEEQVVYTPEMREGDWYDYNIRIKPFSMARQDPNVKVRRTMEFATTVIPAAVQAYQALGPAFKLEQFIARVGREIGLDDLDEFFDSQYLQSVIQNTLGSIPIPPKLAGPVQQPGAGGFRPQQPNPAQMGPSGGMSPDQEQAARQQAGAAEPQADLRVRQLAGAAR